MLPLPGSDSRGFYAESQGVDERLGACAQSTAMRRFAQAATALGAVMRSRNLRRVELAWGASIAAEWAHFVALGVFAYAAGGTAAVGIAGLVRMLPAALLAPLASSLGDRFRRE